MIDKINLRTIYGINIDDLKKIANKFKFQSDHKRIGSNKSIWSYRVSKSDSKFIDFKLNYSTSTYTKSIYTNPNRFDDFYEYYNFLQSLIGRDHIETAVITRIDFAVDLSISLKEALSGLNIQYKREAKLFIDSSESREGITVGKGSEKIVIYDKLKRNKELENGQLHNQSGNSINWEETASRILNQDR